MKQERMAPNRTVSQSSEVRKNNTKTISHMFELEGKTFTKPISCSGNEVRRMDKLKTFCT
jgi:hypothetical protein